MSSLFAASRAVSTLIALLLLAPSFSNAWVRQDFKIPGPYVIYKTVNLALLPSKEAKSSLTAFLLPNRSPPSRR